jgi:uncharacterized membrane protein YedE/YeeE
MIAAIASLVLGCVIGYLGQRSRLCFVAGYRDYFLTRNTYILKGALGAVIGVLGGYILFGFLGGSVPMFPMLLNTPGMSLRSAWLFAVIGGLGLGFFAVLSGGCPYRMHIMASEGKKTYWVYLLGFYVGLIFFNLVTAPLLEFISQYLR